MFQSILQNIPKPFGRNANQQTTRNSPGPGHNDRIEDGFLLVGDTASERTTILGSSFRADQVDAPPNYKEVSGSGLPTYQQYNATQMGQSPTLDVTQFPGIQHGNPFKTGSPTVNTRSAPAQQENRPAEQGFTHGRSNKTAISDIPFAFGNGLELNSNIQDIYSSGILQQKHFDFSLYEYSFDVERSFLSEQDFNYGDAEADMVH